MADGLPEPGERWGYKGRSYNIIANGDTKRVKDNSDGAWSRAVEYDQVPEPGEAALDFTFIRKEADFAVKFTRER